MVKHPRLKPYGIIAAGVVATIGLFIPQSSAQSGQSGQSASAQGPFLFPKPATSGGPFTQTPGDFFSSASATQPPALSFRELLARHTLRRLCRKGVRVGLLRNFVQSHFHNKRMYRKALASAHCFIWELVG
jgi:hypothetical protein